MKIAVAGAALALTVAAPLSAWAGATSTASLNGFTITLYDLNPGDGIAPSISFSISNGQYGSYARTTANDGTAGSQTGNTWSLQPFGPTSASSVVGLASASASLSGTLAGGSTLTAQGSAPGTTLLGYGTDYSAAASTGSDYYYGGLAFALSPDTLAVFGGSYSLFAQTTVGQVVSPPFNYYSETATAGASISVNGTGPAGSGTQQSGQSQSLYASYQSTYDPVTGQFVYTGQTLSALNVPLAATFTNASASPISGTLVVSVSVNGNSRILAAVPEPATYGLMFAGLAVLLVQRRHNRRA